MEPYYASFALSYLLTLCTLALLVSTLGGVNLRSVLVLAMLLWSRAFIDYSSSGLENPLTYALLALYMAVFLNRQDSDAKALVRFVEPLALSEPFLARLTARHGTRVGHYERAFPAGFLESVASGENRIEDPALRALYDDVDLAVRAPCWRPAGSAPSCA